MGGTNYLRYPKYNSFYKSVEGDVSKKALPFFCSICGISETSPPTSAPMKIHLQGNAGNIGQVNADNHASFLNFVCLSRRPDKQKK